MNYYYDVILNFSDKLIWFYEWEDSDILEYFKKIPLVYVSSKQFRDIVSHEVRVSLTFLESIKDKSKCNQETYSYVAIFADKNGCIAIEFDNEGKSVSRSMLSLVDEVNINEIIYTLNTKSIDYEIIKSIKYSDSLRYEDKLKLIIKTEVNSLIRKKDYLKLEYLYMEWFNKKCDGEDISLKMLESIDKEDNVKLNKLYNLIKLSYNNV